MQAEILTFQKLSFNKSNNRLIIFLLEFSQSLDKAQHAILLFLLSLSHRHFVISSTAEKASGNPIRPSALIEASLISGFELDKLFVRLLITYALICPISSSYYFFPITSYNVNNFKLFKPPFLMCSSFSKFSILLANIRFKAAIKSRALIQRLSQQS